MHLPPPQIVGIRFPQWYSFGPAILGGMVDFMRSHGSWRLVTENDSYGEMEAVRIDGNWSGDGLILFRSTEEELAGYRQRGVAVVLTSTEGPDLGFPRAVPDNDVIGRMAARHLLACGLSDFAFLARGETLYKEANFAPGFRVYARQRLKGFGAELAHHLIEPRIHYLRGRPLWEASTWRELEAEVVVFLESLPKPCGLFVVDDALAAVALRAAGNLGIRVPDELAVIGYGDDHCYCYASYPALSSIVHPAREIGRTAAELLWRQMNGEAVSGITTVPAGEAAPRESSDTLAIEDPVVRDLVGWIRLTGASDAIRVGDLASRCGLSQTTIKERFARSLGRSPKQVIMETRLFHLKRLLANPSLGLVDISKQMSFATAHELNRFFAKATGIRIGEYRRQLELLAHPQHALRLAVIFDMDGTLFDSETMYYQALANAYAEQGGTLDSGDYFSHYMGTTNEATESRLAEIAPGGFDQERFAQSWRNHFDLLLKAGGLQPFPDVRRALSQLRDQGVPVTLASSSELAEINRLLGVAGLGEFFGALTGGDEVTRGKPDPEIFLLASRRIGQRPENCVVVENSAAGVAAAIAAGMRVIHVERREIDGNTIRHGATRTVGNLDEVDWFSLNEWLGDR